MSPPDYLYQPDPEELHAIRTTPGTTRAGKPFDHHVEGRVRSGAWRLECVRPDVLGLSRPLEIYRGRRHGNLIVPWPRSDDSQVYCPARWADLRIGSGACGLRCRACFLILTRRAFADPSRHLVYDNVDDYERAVRRWLQRPTRKSLGLGIDSSDSLLYEGVTGHARRLAPLFADPGTNPHGCQLFLLTKSTNVGYLEGLPRENILVTFSLNAEEVADQWEGKFPDGTRVTPSISRRLEASLRAQEMGFEVRWRIDPILPVQGWRDLYRHLLLEAARKGHRPSRITLGSFRLMQTSLDRFTSGWGLPPVEWQSPRLVKDGSHYHLPAGDRIDLYTHLSSLIQEAWKAPGATPTVALCKEPWSLRKELGLAHDRCNCT